MSKNSFAREKLEEVLVELSKEFDLSGNRIGSGVKTGGDVRTKDKYIEEYISYKNADRRAVQLTIFKVNEDDDYQVQALAYRTNKTNNNEFKFAGGLEQFNLLKVVFKEHLKEILKC